MIKENETSTRTAEPIAFMRGGRLFQIVRCSDGQGYIGYRDGRVVSCGSESGEVARRLLAAERSAGSGMHDPGFHGAHRFPSNAAVASPAPSDLS
jgi:hypothetical protein